MFKVKMTDAKLLRDMFQAIAILIDEATFKLTPDNIQLRAMDPSRVAMIDFLWPKTIFDEYECDQPQKMCVNITEFLKLLRRTAKDEIIELTLNPETARLQISITGHYTRTFNMPTLEPQEEETPTPKITFKATAKTTTEGLRQAIEDAQLVSDHVRIEVDTEKLTLNATGDLMGATITLKKNSDALLDLQTQEPSKATFSLSYLAEIIKAASATSEIATLQFANDMPIQIDFHQPKEGKLTFYLAPRIEVE
ncbi:MAG: proliferating cell nuclear antigen (pcna) [Candidatus Bathyarchaeota archaeon]|nr:MAG: proliferating cell nuclear antigen (pcna) [Candidatus Bathyarchaeota archaeon]